ncbi:MAG TPA: peptidase M42 [Clostridiales bacterium]|mgnify:CR=1 FL=1|nr:peptidase M42 [Clostridiales bacterium]
MKTDSLKLIQDLSNANGISGFEDEVLEVARKYIGDSLDVKEDTLRNLYCTPKNQIENKPVVMLDGHTDEVGFMIQTIKNDGTMKFIPIGSWFAQNLGSQRVRIRNSDGDYIKGVVASKPPHFMNPSERNTVIEITGMVIDVGAVSKEEVTQKFKIEPGAPVVPEVTFEFNPMNKVMIGKAFDDRLGCACVLDTLTQLQGSDLNVKLVGSLSSQEEVGLRGAKVAAQTIRPDIAIVFEGTPSDDNFTDASIAQGAMGKGPQIRHRDSSMVGNPRFIKFARDIAKKENIKFQDAVRENGGTNAGNIHLSNTGVPTIVIGIPVRYAHTHYCYSSYNDYTEAVRWAVAILKNIDKDIIAEF